MIVIKPGQKKFTIVVESQAISFQNLATSRMKTLYLNFEGFLLLKISQLFQLNQSGLIKMKWNIFNFKKLIDPPNSLYVNYSTCVFTLWYSCSFLPREIYSSVCQYCQNCEKKFIIPEALHHQFIYCKWSFLSFRFDYQINKFSV